MLMNKVFLVFAALSVAASTFAMDDLGSYKRQLNKNHETRLAKKLPQWKAVRKDGLELGIIIGRGFLERDISVLPGQAVNTRVYIYADVDREKHGNDRDPTDFWYNFDSVSQVRKIEKGIFDFIGFDWSVIKFLVNFDDIIPALWDLVAEGGEMWIPAGNQKGMYSLAEMAMQISDKKYPVTGESSFFDRDKLGDEMRKRQQKYLEEICGQNNVQLIMALTNPLRPDKANNLSSYFICRKPRS